MSQLPDHVRDALRNDRPEIPDEVSARILAALATESGIRLVASGDSWLRTKPDEGVDQIAPKVAWSPEPQVADSPG